MAVHKTRLFTKDSSKLWVGAGAISNKTLEGVQHVLKNEDIDGIVFGSITMDEKAGNPGTTFRAGDGFTLNSIGLRNLGYQKYKEGELERIVSFVHKKRKKIIVSVAGDTATDYMELLDLAHDCNADGVELNFGCPNKWGMGGKQKEIVAFNLELMATILEGACMATAGLVFPLGIKLSSYEPGFLDRVASFINEYDRAFPSTITYIATSNTIPNCYAEDENGESYITKHAGNPNGYGGMGGKILRRVAEPQVRQLRPLLNEGIGIMGVGGIYTGKDMQAYIEAGADAVQLVSAYYEKEDPSVFSDILAQYAGLV
jgi:dihydroorotate dehydrogenase (fumarate)